MEGVKAEGHGESCLQDEIMKFSKNFKSSKERRATQRIVTKFALFVETQHGTVRFLILETRRPHLGKPHLFGLPSWTPTNGGSMLGFDS
jgi:hypothetical protein